MNFISLNSITNFGKNVAMQKYPPAHEGVKLRNLPTFQVFKITDNNSSENNLH